MKSYKISIFIFAVIGVLACICAVFPEEGITVGTTTLNFPSINDVLTVDSGRTETGDIAVNQIELDSIQKELDSIHQIEIAPYITFFEQAPNKIYFPNNDFTLFDPLYAALEDARHTPVRIVHYGDSQIEEDRITKELRYKLQTTFGGSGVGLLPYIQNITSLTTRQISSNLLTRKMAYGPQSYRSADHIYGPLMRMDILSTPTSTSISAKSTENRPENYFTKVTVLTRPLNKTITIKTNHNDTATINQSQKQYNTSSFIYTDSISQITINTSGYGYIYGVMLDDTIGVSVDNVPMRGCSGTVFSHTDPTTMRAYFEQTNTKLIIMQFTGNSVPYLSGDKSITAYINKIRTQIRFMQKQAPDAAILFIGPSDMLQNKDGVKSSYPLLPKIDRAMQKAVNEENAAYWSIFETMGGKGSMKQWTEKTPALAGKDGIHFTRLGAQLIGEKLTDAIMKGYLYYTVRNDYYQTMAEKELNLCQ